MLPSIDIFGLHLPCFGLMMFLGMVSAFLLISRNIRKTDITENDFYSVAIIAISCGLIGAKLLYWLVEIKTILAYPRLLLETLTSGFVFYGALILGVAGIGIFCKIKKQKALSYYDLISPSFAIGQAFGRIGCFLAGCCYGAPTESSIGVIYPANPECAAPAGIKLLPTQLMESVFLLLLTVVLTIIFRKQKKKGTTTGWYFILYGIWRFIIEFFRSDDRGALFGLSTSQCIGIFVVIAGIAILLFFRSEETGRTGKDVSRETSPDEDNERTIIEVIRETGSGTAPVIELKKSTSSKPKK